MYLGVELIARHDLTLNLGNYFETWLSDSGEPIRRTLGRDEYHTQVSLRPEARVAATGRIHICQLDTEAAGLGPLQAPPSRPVAIHSGDKPIFLNIRTNTSLEVTALARTFGLRINLGSGDSRLYTFDDPRLFVDKVSPGRYMVDLSRVTVN